MQIEEWRIKWKWKRKKKNVKLDNKQYRRKKLEVGGDFCLMCLFSNGCLKQKSIEWWFDYEWNTQ